MLKSAEKTGTNEYTVELTIEAEAFKAAITKAYHQNKGKINVPGFRKGKAPQAIIEKHYGESVFFDDALEIAFPEAYDAAVEEAGMQLGSQLKTFSGIAIHQSRLDGGFTGEAVVHDGSIKIGEALLHVEVHHLLQFFHVHLRLVIGVQNRKTHQSKSEFFHHLSSIYKCC